jgi:tagatose 6-phosphate kinase
VTHQILIINTNPLLNLVHDGDFISGAINRVNGLAMHAEGKGVNVARVLARLHHRVILTGFAGGHSGAWLRDLVHEEGIEDAFVATTAPVRVGFMASSDLQHHPTSVLPNGFPVNHEECGELLRKVDVLLPQTRLVIISGSVPDPAANGLYADILALCDRAGIPCWLDAHGTALNQALESSYPPLLAKPNREEYAQADQWHRVKEVHVTDGDAPVEVSLAGEGQWRVTPPAIRQRNPVGCGDCYLAGLAHGWLLGWALEERLRIASAAGAANALRADVAMITPHEIESLLGDVEVERLS